MSDQNDAERESDIFVSYEECSSSSMSDQNDAERESGETPTDMRPTYVLILMELCQG
jgi:hypothetical protein